MEGRVDEHRCRWVEEVVVEPMELLFYFLKLGRGCQLRVRWRGRSEQSAGREGVRRLGDEV